MGRCARMMTRRCRPCGRPAVSLIRRPVRGHARRTRCNSGCSGSGGWAPTSSAARCATATSAWSGPATRRPSRSWQAEGAIGAADLDDFVARLTPPRVAWVMVPAAATEAMIDELAKRMAPGDTIIDGGNSYYHDDIRRAKALAEQGPPLRRHRDERRRVRARARLLPHDRRRGRGRRPARPALPDDRPGRRHGARARPAGPASRRAAEQGYLHCGPAGAGHFVKMVHNGIEYGIMAAYAEGMNILAHAERGAGRPRGQRRDDAAARARALPVRRSTSPRSPRSGAAAASSRRGCSISPRTPCPCRRRSTSSAAASPIPGRGAGRSSPRSTRVFRPTSCRRPCSTASSRGARPTSPTGSCRRCARSSAATTSRSRPERGAARGHVGSSRPGARPGGASVRER